MARNIRWLHASTQRRPGQGRHRRTRYPRILGLVAAVATHGAIVETSKNKEKTRLQEEADRVLDPYKEVLAAFSYRELMERGLPLLNIASAPALIAATDVGDGWIVESFPVFVMTQDRSALVLENALSIYAAKTPTVVRYRNIVKVVSNAQEGEDLPALWGAAEGKLLKEESALLFAHSLRLLLQAAGIAPSGVSAERTFRYSEGKEQRMERAQLVRESCGRAVIKTLRGWLMSVPLRLPAEYSPPPECNNGERYPA